MVLGGSRHVEIYQLQEHEDFEISFDAYPRQLSFDDCGEAGAVAAIWRCGLHNENSISGV